MKVIIVDYDCGNLRSIKNMISRIGYESEICSDKNIIQNADKIILPGVGSFDYGITQLKKLGVYDFLKQLPKEKHLLGICLGMQMLLNESEEGTENGLSLIEGSVIRFPSNNSFPVPHMGWNSIKLVNGKENLLLEKSKDYKFYFTHSFYASCKNPENKVAETDYIISFDSIIKKGNIFGVQFHPEKSHKYGMEFFKNFLSL